MRSATYKSSSNCVYTYIKESNLSILGNSSCQTGSRQQFDHSSEGKNQCSVSVRPGFFVAFVCLWRSQISIVSNLPPQYFSKWPAIVILFLFLKHRQVELISFMHSANSATVGSCSRKHQRGKQQKNVHLQFCLIQIGFMPIGGCSICSRSSRKVRFKRKV